MGAHIWTYGVLYSWIGGYIHYFFNRSHLLNTKQRRSIQRRKWTWRIKVYIFYLIFVIFYLIFVRFYLSFVTCHVIVLKCTFVFFLSTNIHWWVHIFILTDIFLYINSFPSVFNRIKYVIIIVLIGIQPRVSRKTYIESTTRPGPAVHSSHRFRRSSSMQE